MAAYSLPVKGTVKKSVLRNYIRHADTHNRVQEEREMWRLRQLEQQTQLQSYHSKPRHTLTRGRLLSDTLRDRPDDSEEEEESSSSYWTRQLMKVEENDPDRWGHSGYKELYPEEFISTDEEREGKRETKRKRERVRETKRKRSSTYKQSKRTRLSASTSSGGSESEKEFKRHKRKEKKKRNKKRNK